MKHQILAYLDNVRAALEAGSLEIEMYHDQNSTGGHSEVNFILEGNYLGSQHRIHFTSTQDWSTQLRTQALLRKI